MKINKLRGRLLAEMALDGVQSPEEALVTAVYAYAWIKTTHQLEKVPTILMQEIQDMINKEIEEAEKEKK